MSTFEDNLAEILSAARDVVLATDKLDQEHPELLEPDEISGLYECIEALGQALVNAEAMR